MNWILLGICTLAGLTLISCGSVGNGPSVDEPSVQQMNDLEHQWGLPDARRSPRGGSTFTVPDATSNPPVESLPRRQLRHLPPILPLPPSLLPRLPQPTWTPSHQDWMPAPSRSCSDPFFAHGRNPVVPITPPVDMKKISCISLMFACALLSSVRLNAQDTTTPLLHPRHSSTSSACRQTKELEQRLGQRPLPQP